MKRGSALVLVRKMCIKVMLKYYCLSVILAKRVMIPGAGENLRREHTHIYWRECELLQPFGKAIWEIVKN